jgi:hypothetical protein
MSASKFKIDELPNNVVSLLAKRGSPTSVALSQVSRSFRTAIGAPTQDELKASFRTHCQRKISESLDALAKDLFLMMNNQRVEAGMKMRFANIASPNMNTDPQANTIFFANFVRFNIPGHPENIHNMKVATIRKTLDKIPWKDLRNVTITVASTPEPWRSRMHFIIADMLRIAYLKEHVA